MNPFDKRLYKQGLLILNIVEKHIKQVEEANLTNSQFFLEFEDNLNTLSVKDHENSNT